MKKNVKPYYIFNSEPGVNILGLDPIIRAFSGKVLKKFAGAHLAEGIFYEFEKGTFRAGGHTKHWETLAAHFLRKIKNPQFEQEMVRQIKKYAVEINVTCKEVLKKLDHGTVSEAQRKYYITKLFGLFQNLCEYGLIVPIIDIGNGDLSKEVETVVKNRIARPSDLSDSLLLLTYRYEENLDFKEEKALAKLADFIYQDSALRKKLKSPEVTFEQLPLQVRKKVSNYVSDWGWSHYSYCGPEYTVNDAFQAVRGLVALSISPKQYLKKRIQDLEDNKKNQAKLMARLSFAKAEKHLLKTAQDVSETKNLRAKMMFYADYTINNLLKPFLVKEGLTLRQFGMCTVKEVQNYFKTGKLPSAEILNQRYSYCILFSGSRGEKFLFGTKARRWFENNVKVESVDKNVKEISGQVAYASKKVIKGTVRVVNVTADMKKFNSGDILVSIATTPEIVPVMKRASAILSDIGGMTCHAAIVSRELKVPCIVGLKVVTQFVKDGDRVEVDTDKGSVKKL